MKVTVTDAAGSVKAVTAVADGVYSVAELAPGRYTLRATAPGFAAFEKAAVEVAAGRRTTLSVTLEATLGEESVTVSNESRVSSDPENNASAVVLQGSDLDALPDDPDDLALALRSLAGPSAGPGGGQFLVDGFSSGRVPPKESIREIRINQNPFSAEYERLGFGRIEILTKPGTDRFRGQGFLNFNDESINSRNPFAPARAPYQARLYGGNFSGPLGSKRASFFLDFERREVQDNALINAFVLDPALNVTSFRQSLLVPQRRLTFSPRFDYQLTQQHSFVIRYAFLRGTQQKAGVGEFSLLSQAFDVANTSHTLQVSETAIINQQIINETRFQLVRRRRTQEGDNSLPTLQVLEAFTGGGARNGFLVQHEDRWELHNLSTWAAGRHTLRAGARLRGVRLSDTSEANFNGTFTFGGGGGPLLDANEQVVRDDRGEIVLTPITSIERYRRTLLFREQGLTPAAIRALGGGPTQFSIAGGTAEARAGRFDLGVFVQDDWRVRPNLTLSAGLRYETQTNISSRLNFSPRVAFAWLPDAGRTRRPKTVIRGGFGVFYERFGESLTLQAARFDGSVQRQFVVSDPAVLDLFPVAPSVETLSAFDAPGTVWRVSENLQSPYTLQFAFSAERQLPYNFTVSATFIKTRMLHMLRARNVNAPLPGTFVPGVPGSGVRPDAGAGDIFLFESSGRFDQSQLVISVNNRLGKLLTLFSTYVLNKANSDTDDAFSFPVDQYDLSGEYGRSALDVRHSLSAGGTVNGPWGVRLNPFVILRSGAPFNITVGRDLNGDTLFTERPALASDPNAPGVIATPFGSFDPHPDEGRPRIPRNFGEGPSFFTINLRVSRTFGFSDKNPAPKKAQANSPGEGQPVRDGRSIFAEVLGSVPTEKRYFLTLSVQASNVLNHTNAGPVVGNLSSPFFGRSTASAGSFGSASGSAAAGNRRIEAQLRFSF